MRPPISRSITIAARMNGPLPPDLGMGGVVSDIRALHFGHRLVENRQHSGGDYSYPSDRARGFLRAATYASGADSSSLSAGCSRIRKIVTAVSPQRRVSNALSGEFSA